MKEEFEDDLKRRISEVFDQYDDAGADEGWMLLRQQFPAPANKRGVTRLWWISAAAVILLCLGIGLWLRFDKADESDAIALNKPVKPKTGKPQTAERIEAEPVKKGSEVPQTTTGKVNQNNNNTNIAGGFTPGEPVLAMSQRAINNKQAVTAYKRGATENNLVADGPMESTVNRGKKDSVISTPRSQAAVEQYASATVPAQKPATTADVVKPPFVKQPDEANQKPIDRLFARDYANNTQKKQDQKDDKLVNFGVYAATYVNYAKGSDNRVNVGAGVSSDFRISKNLKLSTGVSIAQNSFNYNVSSPAELPAVAADASMVANSLRAADEKGFNTSIAPPALQNYNASLVGLDVPLNLKFEFDPDKNDTYISAGVSSGTFLNQSYNYRYSYSSITRDDNRVVNEKIEQGFGNFYFARTLNVAFGVGYPLGKSNRLVIEPFVKYPLDGLGAQQIKFGAGGINLKLNFQARKK
ncbi:hypothetical protein LT679_06670 [Mucilaginibacter roseus]|uniref:Outer membrane protein beta-barrel domain-containing protein n=1 Tax=Mucilaginibacter roseus TaxID=1528868 RepID=A0ABS8U3Y5_9SPHI|nr:hypothetical protein [Mucilaginibacter roseus]MCD8740281.1 hypothetical protein [Mucilaginibacter roseus]